METWKDIEGYEGKYQVSDKGRVRGLDRITTDSAGRKYKEKGVIKSQRLNSDGYPRVTLSKKSKKKNHRTYRLVAIAFIPNLENKPQINHINGIKTDNRTENLEWCTIQENIKHSNETGLAKVVSGEKHMWAKLKDKEVLEIFRRSHTDEPQRSIAKDYNTSISVVSRIKTGVRWGRLTKGLEANGKRNKSNRDML